MFCNGFRCGGCENIKVEDDIYVIGAPRNLEYTLAKGVISSKSRTTGFNKYIQIAANLTEDKAVDGQ